ncbi:MAG: TPM domain-containing protein [Desulfovibrio sp.]|jgi:hypothetical protein|nr:TPM domain-containing protein [Desulfovibrio sp.]
MRLLPARSGPAAEETRGRRFLRLALACCLLACAVWGMGLNGERQGRFRGEGGSVDDAGFLSPEQEESVREYCARFFKAYGVALRIQIRNGPPDDSRARAGGQVFLGLNLKDSRVLLYAPPLVRVALGEEFILSLSRDHFPPYFARGDWAEGLAGALSLLAVRLDATLLKGEKAP